MIFFAEKCHPLASAFVSTKNCGHHQSTSKHVWMLDHKQINLLSW